MKKHLFLSTIILAIGAFLFAQEKIEVSMKVIKDGKVVKDTTYVFDDAKKAKHAVHMFDAIASKKLDIHMSDSDDHHMEFIHKEGNEMKHDKHVVFISEDGKKVKKTEGCNYTWVSKGDGEEKVIVMKMDHDSDGHMYVTSDEEDGNVRVIVKELKDGDCEDGKKVIKKEIIIISEEEGDDGTWTIKEGDNGEKVMWKKIEGKDGEIITIKKIKGDGDEEEIEVEVEVITKEMQEKAVKKEDITKKEKKKKKK